MAKVSAGTPAGSGRDRLTATLRPVVAALGYDLEDVTVTRAGRRSLVRVSVDADGGIDLDGVAAVSRAVSDALDAAEPGGADFAGPYVLEVSSPGVDRPLTEPRHWHRARGHLVRVPVGDRTVEGRVVGTDDAGVELSVDGRHERLGWSELGDGKVQVEFNRADDGGGAS